MKEKKNYYKLIPLMSIEAVQRRVVLNKHVLSTSASVHNPQNWIDEQGILLLVLWRIENSWDSIYSIAV